MACNLLKMEPRPNYTSLDYVNSFTNLMLADQKPQVAGRLIDNLVEAAFDIGSVKRVLDLGKIRKRIPVKSE
jgi:hypothetical protein